MLEQQTVSKLEQIVGKKNCSTEKADLICYSYDATQQQFLPDIVLHPTSAEEISQIMQLANAEQIPVFPRGAGSGFTGGSLPTKGGIVLSTEQLDAILEIDEENLVATVEPGVVTGQFQQAVEMVGLFYPPATCSTSAAGPPGAQPERAPATIATEARNVPPMSPSGFTSA